MKGRFYRLPKAQRILKSQEFKNVFREGKKVAAEGLILYFLKNDLDTSRLGISVSRANFKDSHERNKIKRLIKEAYRKNKNSLNAGFDLVFLVSPLFKNPTYEKTQKQILYLFEKTGALRKND